MLKKLLFVASLWFCVAYESNAQAIKVHNDPVIWTELEADYFFPEQSFFYFRNQYRYNTNSLFTGISESGAFKNMSEVFVLGGYNLKFSDHWRGAISARYTFTPANDNQIYLAMLQHIGKIGSVDFIKSLTYDITAYKTGDARGRTRPRFALERSFNAGNHTIRPHLSYELFIHNDFKNEKQNVETRTIDRTRWRMAISYKATPYLWLTPYFTKQTDYFMVESSFTPTLDENGVPIVDADGFPVLEERKGGKLNNITPIFGLEIRFMLPGKNVSEKAVPNLGSINDASGN